MIRVHVEIPDLFRKWLASPQQATATADHDAYSFWLKAVFCCNETRPSLTDPIRHHRPAGGTWFHGSAKLAALQAMRDSPHAVASCAVTLIGPGSDLQCPAVLNIYSLPGAEISLHCCLDINLPPDTSPAYPKSQFATA